MPAFKKVVPYANDALDLPVRNVDQAITHYTKTLGFRLVSRVEAPLPAATLERDSVRIALVENGRDPEQEGAYIEVNGLEVLFEEINGRSPADNDIKLQANGGISQRVFFHIAPDGLCFMFGETV
jgi:catechol 2,3-dioxygenase-like lactoylglutathione lyase family enzyme